MSRTSGKTAAEAFHTLHTSLRLALWSQKVWSPLFLLCLMLTVPTTPQQVTLQDVTLWHNTLQLDALKQYYTLQDVSLHQDIL